MTFPFRLASRQEYERSSVPAGLKLHPALKQQNASFSDISDLRNRKRPVSLGMERSSKSQYYLSPHGGARSKVPISRLPSAPDSVSALRSDSTTRSKSRIESLEMDMFKLKLGNGSAIGSSSTDDVTMEGAVAIDNSVWKGYPPSPRLPNKKPISEEDQEFQGSSLRNKLGGSMQSLNSSGSSAVFSIESPPETSITGSIPNLHSTPIKNSHNNINGSFRETLPEGSESFYQTFIERDISFSPNKSIPPLTIGSPTSDLASPSHRHSALSDLGSSRHSALSDPGSSRNSAISDLSSPLSGESERSKFSYSDLPGMNMTFINDRDEVTEL